MKVGKLYEYNPPRFRVEILYSELAPEVKFADWIERGDVVVVLTKRNTMKACRVLTTAGLVGWIFPVEGCWKRVDGRL